MNSAGLAAAPPEVEATEWISPARKAAPDAGAWLAIPDLRRLPAKPTPRHAHGTHGPHGRPDRLPARPPTQARRAPVLRTGAPPVAPPSTFLEPVTAPNPVIEVAPQALAAPPVPESPVVVGAPRRSRRRLLVGALSGVTVLALGWMAIGAIQDDSSRRVAVAPPPPSKAEVAAVSHAPALGAVLVADGTRRSVLINDGTVADLLRETGITLDGDDEVTPSLTDQVTAGMSITVIRVQIQDVTGEEAIPAPVEQRPDATLAQGVVKVVREGTDGLARVHYSVTTRDGVETARTKVGEAGVITAPTAKIVRVGTKKSTRSAMAPSSSVGGTVSTPSTAGTAPVTIALPPDTVKVAPQTPPSGTSESGDITHYVLPGAPGPGYCAHKTLPFGTVVTVTNNATGGSITCVVKDRGPYGAGRILDLNPNDFVKLAPLGQGVIHGSISWRLQ